MPGIRKNRCVMNSPSSPTHALLMMQTDDENVKILKYCLAQNPFLTWFYFMMLFEDADILTYESGARHYIIDIRIGDPVEDKTYDPPRMIYPIAAELKIDARSYNRLREPFRNKVPSLPSIMYLGS